MLPHIMMRSTAGSKCAGPVSGWPNRPPLRAEGLARHRRQVMELQQRLILHQRIARELAFEFVAEREVADLPHAMDELDLAEALIDVGIAREAEEGREAGAGRQQEESLARKQRVGDERARRLAAEINGVARLDLLEPRGQRAVGHLDREEFELVGIGRARDRVSAQQRAPFARKTDHHELARSEAEAWRACDREAEQMLVPMAHRKHLLDGQRGGGGQLGGFGNTVTHHFELS
jgi:hypothetical protein